MLCVALVFIVLPFKPIYTVLPVFTYLLEIHIYMTSFSDNK